MRWVYAPTSPLVYKSGLRIHFKCFWKETNHFFFFFLNIRYSGSQTFIIFWHVFSDCIKGQVRISTFLTRFGWHISKAIPVMKIRRSGFNVIILATKTRILRLPGSSWVVEIKLIYSARNYSLHSLINWPPARWLRHTNISRTNPFLDSIITFWQQIYILISLLLVYLLDCNWWFP